MTRKEKKDEIYNLLIDFVNDNEYDKDDFINKIDDVAVDLADILFCESDDSRKKWYQENKEKRIKQMQERYKILKEKRICIGCMKKLDDDYQYTICQGCRELRNKKRKLNGWGRK